jgi:hypothetical protein
MRHSTGRIAVRFLALAAILICAAAWIGTYHRPFGISRVFNDAWTLESARGAIIFSRLYDESPSSVYVLKPRVVSPHRFGYSSPAIARSTTLWRCPTWHGHQTTGSALDLESSGTDRRAHRKESGSWTKTVTQSRLHRQRSSILQLPFPRTITFNSYSRFRGGFFCLPPPLQRSWRSTKPGANAPALPSTRFSQALQINGAAQRCANRPRLWMATRRAESSSLV